MKTETPLQSATMLLLVDPFRAYKPSLGFVHTMPSEEMARQTRRGPIFPVLLASMQSWTGGEVSETPWTTVSRL